MGNSRCGALVAAGLIGLFGASCSSTADNRADVLKGSGSNWASTTVAPTSTSGAGEPSTTSGPEAQITTAPTLPPSTAPTATPATTTPSKATCQADDTKLAQALTTYAKNQQPTVPVTVKDIRHAPSDTSWARAAVVPESADSLDGFVAIAHCVGEQWTVKDMGTSGVGCNTSVPSKVRREIGLECE